jgi:hypothetical protein
VTVYLCPSSTPIIRAAMTDGLVGAIATPDSWHDRAFYSSVVWCADNGCYTKPGRAVDEFVLWLAGFPAESKRTCLFATALDVVGDCTATLSRFVDEHQSDHIKAAGYRVGFVAQDGCEDDVLPWDDFDALFIGGSTGWKLGAGALSVATEARHRGKWVHMGRVNSLKRYQYASGFCDSVDGTYTVFAPDKNICDVVRWSTQISNQLTLGVVG